MKTSLKPCLQCQCRKREREESFSIDGSLIVIVIVVVLEVEVVPIIAMVENAKTSPDVIILIHMCILYRLCTCMRIYIVRRCVFYI